MDRILGIYIKLCDGDVVSKYKEALECGVFERTIQKGSTNQKEEVRKWKI